MKKEHAEFDCMVCEHPDAPGADLECYFEPESGNLWFAYIGDAHITELLRDTVIQSLERGYAKAIQEQIDNDKLDYALARYESKHYEV